MASSTGKTLLNLPTEILVLISHQTSSIRDACALSQTCSQLHALFTRDKDRLDILRSAAKVSKCPEFDPGDHPVLVRPSSNTWAFPSSTHAKCGLHVTLDYGTLEENDMEEGVFDLEIIESQQKEGEEDFYDALRDFLAQWSQLTSHWPGAFHEKTEELISDATLAQMNLIHHPDLEMFIPLNLRPERTIIALSLQLLTVTRDVNALDNRSASDTEDDLFVPDLPPGYEYEKERWGTLVAVLETAFEDGRLHPSAEISQITEQEWTVIVQNDQKRRYGYALDASPGLMMEHIVRTAFQMLDTRKPCHEPTVLFVLLILSLALGELEVSAPWMKCVEGALKPLSALFRELSRYYFICTKGAPLMSDQWDQGEYGERILEDDYDIYAIEHADILHKRWVKADQGHWATMDHSQRPVDEFHAKVKYFAYGGFETSLQLAASRRIAEQASNDGESHVV